MYIREENGETVVILGDTGESVTVELPGGNGLTFTVGTDAAGNAYVRDENGFDLTRAYRME